MATEQQIARLEVSVEKMQDMVDSWNPMMSELRRLVEGNGHKPLGDRLVLVETAADTAKQGVRSLWGILMTGAFAMLAAMAGIIYAGLTDKIPGVH